MRPFLLKQTKNMSLIAQAKQDVADITANSAEWGLSITMTAPDETTATVTGLHTKHHMAVDTLGNPVNAKNAHASISEQHLVAAGYPVRNEQGEVSLYGHRVSVADSTGTVKHYTVKQWHPDETVGLIVMILDDYE
jgi:hypothetical protein